MPAESQTRSLLPFSRQFLRSCSFPSVSFFDGVDSPSCRRGVFVHAGGRCAKRIGRLKFEYGIKKMKRKGFVGKGAGDV